MAARGQLSAELTESLQQLYRSRLEVCQSFSFNTRLNVPPFGRMKAFIPFPTLPIPEASVHTLYAPSSFGQLTSMTIKNLASLPRDTGCACVQKNHPTYGEGWVLAQVRHLAAPFTSRLWFLQEDL